MSGKLVLPVFIAVIFLGAMILGPLLFLALQPWQVPFHRAMDRAILISAVAALALFWSRFSLEKWWPWDGHAWKYALLGFFIAAISIQAMIGLDLVAAGFTSSHLSAGKIAGRVLLALVAALVAPLLEETVFRGFLQGEITRGLGWRVGWILTAIIFMLAHFIKVPVELDTQPVHPWSGVSAIGAAFLPITHGDFLSGRGLNILMVGLILGGVFLRAGNLWLNAGLHGGWIFGMLLFTGLTRADEPPRYAWAGGDILSSFVTTVVLCLVGFWLWRFYRHPSIKPEPVPATGSSAR